MREILFRIGLKANSYVNGYNRGHVMEMFNNPFDSNTGVARFCIDKGWDIEYVDQFTGLTDKNGVKIFEGDRVRYHFESHNKPSLNIKEREGFVVWQDFRACWAIQLNGYMNNDLWRHINNVVEKCEVIGNIHDKN